MPISLPLLVSLLVVLASPGALGDEDGDAPATTASQSEARAHFSDGNRRYAAGDYAGAEEAFLSASMLDPTLPGPYRNLGLVYLANHRCDAAVRAFRAYLKLRPTGPHTARIEREIAFCTSPSATGTGGSELGVLQIDVVSEGRSISAALVRVDGLPRGGAPLEIQITPGHHRVRVEGQGFVAAEQAVDAVAGRKQELIVELRAIAGAGPSIAPRPARPSHRVLAWALLGVAGVGLAVGAAFGILESSDWQAATTLDRATHTRDDVASSRDRGALHGALAYSGLAVGGAALVTAAVLLVIDPRRGEAHGEPQLATRARRIIVAPSFAPGGGGVCVVGSW